ncbi:MAG TPA: hypothetical protein VJV78_35235 [Polyangiales bacterium]|nr:hypothetical protein [Polyangiales bacterium]
MLTETQTILLVVALAVVAVALVVLLTARSSKHRHAELKRRFGPEYDRAVAEYGSPEKAERELARREKRVHKFKLHPLTDSDRVQFSANWRNVQAQFVDDPSGAVGAANDLIKQVMQARGYEIEHFDQRVADLSVEHAEVVEHYRAARELAIANREGRANTEELRQAFVHYRALFADLLDQAQPAERPQQEEMRA